MDESDPLAGAGPGDHRGQSDVRGKLYALAFVDEFAPLYALFTLWFIDNGVSTSEISVAFAIWAVLAIVLELPSGALADRVDRRKLIAGAFALRATGIGIWLVWPTVTGLAIGAALWALHDTATSGAWEALIHDQLEATGNESRYGVLMARVGQCTHLGLAAGTVAGSGLVWIGVGIETIGWINVAVHSVSMALVLALPDVQRLPNASAGTATPSATGWSAWWRTVGDGLTEVRQRPGLARLAVVGALLGGLFVVDEYVPLLARARGAADATVPLIVIVIWLGLLAGGEVAARRPDTTGVNLATALLAGTAAMAFTLATDAPWALLVIAVGYGVVQTTWVISDARFQATAPSATRATVTSVRGLGEGAVASLAFLLVAVRSDADDPTPGLHWVVGLLAVTSLLVWRWVPGRRTASPNAPAS